MAEEKQKVILSCPRCHNKWAELSFIFDKPLTPEDIRVLDGKTVFKDGDELNCSMCNYLYKSWDLDLAIAAIVPLGDNNVREESIQGQGDTGQGQL